MSFGTDSDTEGKDISVLRGATTIDAAVLMVEFWDKEYVFNAGETRNCQATRQTAPLTP